MHTLAQTIGRTGLVHRWLVMAALMCMLPITTVSAAQVVGKPGDDVVALINTMQPGDELLLYPGTYKSTRFGEVKNKHGRADAWFTIRGVGRVVIENACRENTINITGCSFFRFYNLEITGKEGGAAFKWLGTNSDMIVEDCYMHDLGGQAINCSNVDKMTRLQVRHCHIHHTGGNAEGFYLGHQDGSGSVFDSVFECNFIHDMGGKKGSGFQGDGFDINPGCLGNLFRYNVIYKSMGPGIVLENESAGKPNIIEGNMVWDCVDDANIQVRGNAIVRDNIVMGGKRQYNISKKPDIQATNNVIWDEGSITHEDMLNRGLHMLSTRWTEIQKVAGVQAITPLPGTDGKITVVRAQPKAIVFVPRPPLFKAEAIEQVRMKTAERVLARLKLHEPLILSLLVDDEARQVTLVGGKLEDGLQVKLSFGSKKILPWKSMNLGTLAEILYQLTDAGTDDSEAGLQDLYQSALCNTVAERAVMVTTQLDQLRAMAPEMLEHYRQQVATMKTPPTADKGANE